MQIAILGPLEARDDAGRTVAVSGARLRTLLARLALEHGRPVRVDTLVEAVWGEHPPADEANALQTLVSRLRRLIGSEKLVQSGAGYRLVVGPDDVDTARFEHLVADGSAQLRRGEHAAAADTLRAALELWRGPLLADAGDALAGQARRLADLRLTARIDLAEARLETGDADIAELEALADQHPLHEPLAGQLIRALAAGGRQADALRCYERLRARLADELGVDPSPRLQQLHVALLRGEVAHPVAAPTRRTNLKAQLTSFVGRDAEVARIGKSLEQHRLVTLVGPGGAGKTRLAGESAARITDTAPDGVWLAELAGVTSGADVAQAVLGSVGLREVHLMDRTPQAGRDAARRLCDGLGDRRTLLVLDNCEHVIESAARLAEQLLGECPNLRVLATSREPLGITGEVLLAVPPLGQPAAHASAREALEFPAVQLFADRAAAARPDFAVDEVTVGAVVEIVQRLDGLPLAIELAAARLRTMPVADVAARLSDRFRLLTGGSRTALPRHRTLRAVVEWSWALLTPDERLLAEQLAVFPAGITADSAAAVHSCAAAPEVDDLLASLLDKSLLQPVGDGRRMRMLETIREYGTERLAERAELGAARERHAVHFAAVLAEAEPHLTTAGQLPWFALLTAERENILAALRLRCDIGDADVALQIAVSLGGYAMLLGDHAEVTSWMRDALAVPGATDQDLRLIARAIASMNATAVGLPQSGSEEDFGDLQTIAEELDGVDVSRSPMMSVLRPATGFFAGDEERTRRYLDEAIRGPDRWSRAAARMFLANYAENAGDLDTMRRETEQALIEFRVIGERWGTASTLRMLAQIRTLDGDLDAAVAAYDEALALMHEMQSTDDEMMIYGQLADLAIRQGDDDRARAHLERARGSADLNGTGIASVFVLAALGDLERRLGDLGRARELVDDARRLLDSLPREHPVQGHIRSMVLGSSVRLALAGGDAVAAQRYAVDAYAAAVGTNDLPIVAYLGLVAVEMSVSAGEFELAAQQLGAADRLRGAADLTAPDVAGPTRRAREALGDDVFEREYERGRALARDEAIARLDPAR